MILVVVHLVGKKSNSQDKVFWYGKLQLEKMNVEVVQDCHP